MEEGRKRWGGEEEERGWFQTRSGGGASCLEPNKKGGLFVGAEQEGGGVGGFLFGGFLFGAEQLLVWGRIRRRGSCLGPNKKGGLGGFLFGAEQEGRGGASCWRPKKKGGGSCSGPNKSISLNGLQTGTTITQPKITRSQDL